MTTITATELDRICAGIYEDRDLIIKHNPLGSNAEILLWMLLNSLNSYLSLSENESPCFNGRPDEKTYRDAILFVLRGRTVNNFDPVPYLDKLIRK